MNLKGKLAGVVADAVSKTGIVLREHGPAIAVVTGVAMMIGGTVLAVVRSLDAKEEIKADVEDIKKFKEAGDKKMVRQTRMNLAKDVAKRYGLVVALETVGGVLVFKGYMYTSGKVTALSGLLMAAQSENKRHLDYVEQRWGAEAREDMAKGRDWISDDGKNVTIGSNENLKPERSALCFVYSENTVDDYSFQEDAYSDLKMIQNAVRNGKDVIRRRGYLFLFELKSMMHIRPENLNPVDKLVLWTSAGDPLRLYLVNGDQEVDVMEAKVSDIKGGESCFMIEPEGCEYRAPKDILNIGRA